MNLKLLALTLLMGTITLATPIRERQSSPCEPLLYSNPQCCAVAVIGAAGRDCQDPSSARDTLDLRSSCGSIGKQAECCVIPVEGQDLLCREV
ncbi:fungal hydrophobin-domain-containing protein [Aspergillus aurantiobrunneus]